MGTTQATIIITQATTATITTTATTATITITTTTTAIITATTIIITTTVNPPLTTASQRLASALLEIPSCPTGESFCDRRPQCSQRGARHSPLRLDLEDIVVLCPIRWILPPVATGVHMWFKDTQHRCKARQQ